MENSNSTRTNNYDENDSDTDGIPEEKLNFKETICLINVIVSLTALFGNSLILIIVWKTFSVHSVANILLANRVVSDLAVGLVVQPFFVVNILSGRYLLT